MVKNAHSAKVSKYIAIAYRIDQQIKGEALMLSVDICSQNRFW